ncbi:hypothetical protein GCM10023176_40440 [Micromonospora coerulea]|uniref:Uncharacterized protein n=1 Tax=Micromonospora coerulea TaxID=47856 RepID=A0ABP8SUN8_9ACTN
MTKPRPTAATIASRRRRADMRRAMDNLLRVRGIPLSAHSTSSHMVISMFIAIAIHPDRILTPAMVFHPSTPGENSFHAGQ